MGNLPLCVNKKDGLRFGSYNTGAGRHLSLTGYPPYDMSLEDLRPFPSHSGRVRLEEREEEVMSTIMGVEMDQESVWCYGNGTLSTT